MSPIRKPVSPGRGVRLLGASLAAVVLLSSCTRSSIPTIAPAGLASIDRATVESWVADFALAGNRLVRIRPWRYTNDRGSTSGRAVVRLVRPDSMRFDFRGAFGKSGAAVIVNDDALWAHPEGDFSALIRIAPVFWAAIGHPLVPPGGVSFRGLESGAQRVWQYGYRGDTLTFVAEGNPVVSLRAEMRRDGSTFALSEVLFDSVTRHPTEATVDFPLDPGRFKFEIQEVQDDAEFDGDVWDEP